MREKFTTNSPDKGPEKLKEAVNLYYFEGYHLLWFIVTLGRRKMSYLLDNYRSQEKKQDWEDRRYCWKKSVYYNFFLYESVTHHESHYCTLIC